VSVGRDFAVLAKNDVIADLFYQRLCLKSPMSNVTLYKRRYRTPKRNLCAYGIRPHFWYL